MSMYDMGNQALTSGFIGIGGPETLSKIRAPASGGLVELEGYPAPRAPKVHEVRSVEDLMPYARFLVTAPEWRRNKVGFVGYGRTKLGDRVLLAAHTLYDPWVIEATARALREVGAKVDTIIVDEGLDRELD